MTATADTTAASISAFASQSLSGARQWTLQLLDDLRDAPLATPCEGGGNHAVWVAGHLAYSQSVLLDCFILGKPNRLEKWKTMFDAGTQPTGEEGFYPPLDDLIGAYNVLVDETLDHIDKLEAADFDRPSHAPEEASGMFGTVGMCLSAAAAHAYFHTGQLADARRALGRAPLMM
ncbi:DinB superfamily protein [Pseudobythopirellula maris]|uniref:DinB superfamily protein n=1 Tax=Pseudobythopirellula maris TaxID=2527991 RepID=A0A5C5ZPF9_9BACT|nr:DinB family protein [Pseudobythopirellula maris]TWT89028.1 DinB superfamily protein [Pseudobythopirellula maris]